MCGECIGWIRASQLSFNSFCLVIKEIHVVLWYTDGRLCVFCQLIPDTFLLCYFQFGLIGIRYWLELIIWFSRKKVKVALSRPTLCYPMDHTDRGILQVRILEWVAIPFFRGSSQPRDQTQVSCTAGRFFTSWATVKPLVFQNIRRLPSNPLYTQYHLLWMETNLWCGWWWFISLAPQSLLSYIFVQYPLFIPCHNLI